MKISDQRFNLIHVPYHRLDSKINESQPRWDQLYFSSKHKMIHLLDIKSRIKFVEWRLENSVIQPIRCERQPKYANGTTY